MCDQVLRGQQTSKTANHEPAAGVKDRRISVGACEGIAERSPSVDWQVELVRRHRVDYTLIQHVHATLQVYYII